VVTEEVKPLTGGHAPYHPKATDNHPTEDSKFLPPIGK
jgi:hypothetical protein